MGGTLAASSLQGPSRVAVVIAIGDGYLLFRNQPFYQGIRESSQLHGVDGISLLYKQAN